MLPAGATLLFDIGDFGIWGRTYMPAEGPGRWIAPGPLGHLGSTLPMAIGCKAAHPQSAVLCFAGDGAMGFHFMEMDTAISHNLPVVLVVGNDSAFGIDRNYQMAYYGRPIGTDRRPLRYDRIVAEMGGHGEHAERIEDVPGALSRALACGRPPWSTSPSGALRARSLCREFVTIPGRYGRRFTRRVEREKPGMNATAAVTEILRREKRGLDFFAGEEWERAAGKRTRGPDRWNPAHAAAFHLTR